MRADNAAETRGQVAPVRNFARILGIKFFNDTAEEAVSVFLRTRGVIAIPASPALTKLKYDESYRRSLRQAEMVLLDSGLVATVWRILRGNSVSKISGVRYLETLLRHDDFQRSSRVCWILNTPSLETKARIWMTAHALEHHSVHLLRAVNREDHELLLKIEEQRPEHIVIAILGGAQEELGIYLRDYLLYQPCIHCVGAGLAFLSGAERSIPNWAEHLRIGWLFRLAAQPRMVFPRMAIAISLLQMLVRYRTELPPLQPRWVDV